MKKYYIIKLGTCYYTDRGFRGLIDNSIPDDVVKYSNKKSVNSLISMMTKEAKKDVEIIVCENKE